MFETCFSRKMYQNASQREGKAEKMENLNFSINNQGTPKLIAVLQCTQCVLSIHMRVAALEAISTDFVFFSGFYDYENPWLWDGVYTNHTSWVNNRW